MMMRYLYQNQLNLDGSRLKDPCKEFEKKISKFLNRKFGCAVSSGTAALEIAIKSLNLKKMMK